MIRKDKGLYLLRMLAISAALPLAASAQGVVVRAGNFELGGFVGASYGVDNTRVMGGGNICYGLTRYIMPYAEFSYFPGIGRPVTGQILNSNPPQTYSVVESFPLSDFHGGVHIRIPIRESRVVPYLVIGAGVLHNYARTYTIDVKDSTGKVVQSIPNVAVPSENHFAANFGGGLRFYIGQRFGLRAEAKAYKPSGSLLTDVFGKVEAGFFFEFK